MLFTDIVAGYNKIIDCLYGSKKFYSLSKETVGAYFDQFSSMTRNFYSPKQGSPKDALANAVNNLAQKTFDNVILLNTASRDLYQCIGDIQSLEFSIPILEQEVKDFISFAKQADSEICNIIEAKLPDAKKGNLFASLILQLNNFNLCYENLLNIEMHLNEFNNFLMEPLPESVSEVEYEEFNLNSLVPSNDFKQIISSIGCFSNIYENVSRLLEVPLDDKYYIRRIETGSLVITISCIAIAAMGIVKFIDYCFNKYLSYKKSGLEIKDMHQDIVKNDLEIVDKVLDLNPNLESKQELIEKASDSAFKYFKFNPQFKMNGKVYDAGSDPELLESKNDNEDDDN